MTVEVIKVLLEMDSKFKLMIGPILGPEPANAIERFSVALDAEVSH